MQFIGKVVFIISCTLGGILEAKAVPWDLFGNVGGIETPYLIEEIVPVEGGAEVQIEQWCEVNNDCCHSRHCPQNRIERIKFMMMNTSHTKDPDFYVWRLVWRFKVLENKALAWKIGDRIKMEFDFMNMCLKNNTMKHEKSKVKIRVIPISIGVVPEIDCTGGGTWALH